MKILNIAGARPNFIKLAPLQSAMEGCEGIETRIVHTGQHYDANMSALFFEELEIPPPHINLEVGSATHAVQTAQIMMRFEQVLIDEQPDLVVVVGDVNSTIACSLTAAKRHIPVAHVEAGLRSFDRSMPEEINRILTDALSDLLFTTEPSGGDNLRREGIPVEMIHFVGNTMIDTLVKNRERAEASGILEDLGISPGRYAVMTLHRPGNLDDPGILQDVLSACVKIQESIPIIFPIHPRTLHTIRGSALQKKMNSLADLRIIEPLGYLDFLKLMSEALFVLTDSGGIQEETTFLGVPCLTLRDNTERLITVDQGTNTVVGTHANRITAEADRIMDGAGKKGMIPEKWDGRAAERIAAVIREAKGRPAKDVGEGTQ